MTEHDLEQISKITEKAVNSGLNSFWEHVIEPRFDALETKFDVMTKMLQQNGSLTETQTRTVNNSDFKPKAP